MNEPMLDGIHACVFDAYGTLFDYGSAAARCADLLGDNFAKLNALWREKQLQYTWLRASQNRHADFWQVTGDALDFTMDSLGITNAGLRAKLMNLYLTLEPFPEVSDMLARLKKARFATAILSNGSPDMLRAVVEAAKLGPLLDAVLSVEDVGVFKPHPYVYGLAVNRLDISAAHIAFVSANGWDAHAASAFGMRAIWCNRYGQKRERLPGAPDRVVASLADLPALVGGTRPHSS
jgi:2-haloacid dehalogenase